MLDAGLFLQAQTPCMDAVYAELRAGRKASHWMWFIFPQLKVLGTNPPNTPNTLSDLTEARAYLAHPVLGERLRQCTLLVKGHPDKSAHEIMGSPDDLKLRSCMTLFVCWVCLGVLVHSVLDQFYGGKLCELTVQALA